MVGMADGYAQASGRPALVNLHTAPGVGISVLDFSFLGGSIGVVAGERLARAFEKATSRRVPAESLDPFYD